MKTLTRFVVVSVAAAVLLLATGCNTVSTSTRQTLGGPTFPATDPAQVQILRTEPTRPNIRLGEITAEPSSDSVPAATIEATIQKAAAKWGANAAVIVADRTQVTGAYVTGPWWGRSLETVQGRVIIAVAIRYQ